MDIFQQMLDSLQNDQMRHSLMVHLPVALSILGLPFALLAIIRPKSHMQRWTAVVIYLALTGSAYFTADSGAEAESSINPAISMIGDEIFEEHEEMGEKVWWFGAATTIFLVLTAIPKRSVRITASVVSLGLGLTTAGWVGVTGHYGGELVYKYGAVAPISSVGEDLSSEDIDPRLAYFNEYVRPILIDNCLGCHNPTRSEKSGELNLTSMKTILIGGETGPALVPGDADVSLIVHAISYDDPFLDEMPPEKKGGKLPAEIIAIIEKWIDDGAVWSEIKLDWAAISEPVDDHDHEEDHDDSGDTHEDESDENDDSDHDKGDDHDE